MCGLFYMSAVYAWTLTLRVCDLSKDLSFLHGAGDLDQTCDRAVLDEEVQALRYFAPILESPLYNAGVPGHSTHRNTAQTYAGDYYGRGSHLTSSIPKVAINLQPCGCLTVCELQDRHSKGGEHSSAAPPVLSNPSINPSGDQSRQ
jgi:hypothetical protein